MVRLLAPRNAESAIPIALRAAGSGEGGRLGGRAPGGIRPQNEDPQAVYLLTVPVSVEPYREASVFLVERDLLVGRNRLHYGRDPGAVQIVVHERSTRAASDLFRSPLSERALVFGAEQEDWYTSGDGERVILGRHKVGGRPAIFKAWDLEEPVSDALRAGFVQVIQLDIPGPEDEMGIGDWPFGDGMFHLLGREPFGGDDWLFFWES